MAEPDHERIRNLVESARRGDARALDALCAQLEPRLRALAGARMGPGARRWEDSGDVVQQVLLEVLVTAGPVPARLSAEDVLGRLARRIEWRIADGVRNRRKDAGASAFDGEIADREPSVGAVTSEDTRRWLEVLVEELPEPWRSTVRLCGLEGLGYAEAGRRLDVPEDTVRKRYEKAREALARRVAARRG